MFNVCFKQWLVSDPFDDVECVSNVVVRNTYGRITISSQGRAVCCDIPFH